MIKQLFLNLAQLGKGDWWIEIITSKPQCIYYFGPFATLQEAEAMEPGFVEDLLEEGVYTLQAIVKQCHPTQLTIFEAAETADAVPMV
nr:DUF1816 domain-containing protein [Nodosilinea sp. TSF1-S3]MDF0367098.1 DUF1816 domain-containing protein [Nodosilinea sp. TSF1-S3]